MLIGELSRRAGVNSHQLRYYEAQGLLTPGRTPSGYREYTDDDVVTVRQVRRLLEAGLSTEQIAFLQPCTTGETPELDPCQETLDTLSMRLAELDRRIDTLVGTRQALSTLIEATTQRALRSDDRCATSTPDPLDPANRGG